MATQRCDHSLPQYANAASVTTAAAFVGDPIPLNGAVAVSIQIIATSGAAGSVYVEGTNQDAGTLAWASLTTATLTANQSQVLSYSLADTLTSMHQMRVRFVATTAGNITIALNLRHTTR